MLEIAVSLILLHSPDGYQVQINPEQVTSLITEREHREKGNRLYPDKAKCLVRLADGTQVPVTETCDDVKQMLEAK